MEKSPTSFEPNYKKERFTITIEVFENCINYSLVTVEGVEIHTYEIIGALEALKGRYIYEQSLYNRWAALREKEEALYQNSEANK
jgi:hypothetical protein